MAGAALNMFNLLGFPATAKSHFTTGGSYRFNKKSIWRFCDCLLSKK